MNPQIRDIPASTPAASAASAGGHSPDEAARRGASDRESGVYVHFPWCLKKCPYCDFVSFATERAAIDHRGYADAVLAEMDQRRATLEGRRVGTVFLGGGTPSLWEAEEIGRVLARIREMCEVTEEVEITVECNPTSLDEGRARALRAVGVNRLSVGVQGLSRSRLEFLGRLHDENGGLVAVRQAIASGIQRVSADVIYGVAGGEPQSAEEAAEEVGRVADTGVTHVSAYALTIEPSTVFGELSRKGKLPILGEDTVAEAFLAVREALERRGFSHYEVSNFAKPGDEARHNLGYWRGRDYVGLGCAAYGTISMEGGSARRYRNKTDPERYMAAAMGGGESGTGTGTGTGTGRGAETRSRTGESGTGRGAETRSRSGESEMRSVSGGPARTEGSSEALDPETRLRERIMLGLRVAEGLDLEGAAAELGVPAWTKERRRAAEKLVKRGHLVIEGGRIKVPHGAWLFADGAAAELF